MPHMRSKKSFSFKFEENTDPKTNIRKKLKIKIIKMKSDKNMKIRIKKVVE